MYNELLNQRTYIFSWIISIFICVKYSIERIVNIWYIFVCLGTISFSRLNATEHYGYALCWIKCNKENGLYDKIFLVNVSVWTSIFIQKNEMITIRLKNLIIPLCYSKKITNRLFAKKTLCNYYKVLDHYALPWKIS